MMLPRPDACLPQFLIFLSFLSVSIRLYVPVLWFWPTTQEEKLRTCHSSSFTALYIQINIKTPPFFLLFIFSSFLPSKNKPMNRLPTLIHRLSLRTIRDCQDLLLNLFILNVSRRKSRECWGPCTWGYRKTSVRFWVTLKMTLFSPCLNFSLQLLLTHNKTIP